MSDKSKSGQPAANGGQPSNKPDANTVNRGNQLNPDHQAYWQSRGLPMPADPKARR